MSNAGMWMDIMNAMCVWYQKGYLVALILKKKNKTRGETSCTISNTGMGIFKLVCCLNFMLFHLIIFYPLAKWFLLKIQRNLIHHHPRKRFPGRKQRPSVFEGLLMKWHFVFSYQQRAAKFPWQVMLTLLCKWLS